MALRWENLASTTHSLTPRTENRPLFFGILTPCEKPGATGSAGRCEPGVGRFTDPHPLTCCEITPLSTACFSRDMLRLEERFCAGLRASFFLLCFALPASFTPPPTGEGLALPPLSVPRFSIAEEPGALPQEKTETSYPRASLGMSCRLILLTTSSHGFNRACLGHRWCRFPTRFPKIAHRATRGRVWFSPFFLRASLL